MNNWVNWFRQVSPYVHTHRRKCFVLALSGETIEHENFANIVNDIALLHGLGIRVVLVVGGRPQIETQLSLNGLSSSFHDGLRITTAEMIPHVQAAYGRLRAKFEASLSVGVVNSPMHGAQITVLGGNFVTAKPIGVVRGVDYCFTGQVRNIDKGKIESLLDSGAIVLLPSLGYSLTGDSFNLGYEDLAKEVAMALNAEKLVMFSEHEGLRVGTKLIREIGTHQVDRLLAEAGPDINSEQRRQLAAACHACRNGVRRAHLISYGSDGALLQELFTRDGLGTLVNNDDYEQIRSANVSDINGIMKLIEPLEQAGLLVRRSRELLETEIDYFYVDERDGAVIGCAALYPFPEEKAGELSCFAVSDEYRRCGRGDALLQVIEQRAISANLDRLFVLTTQAEYWFRERGFEPSPVDVLPGYKKASYNTERNSKVFVKKLGS